MSEDDKLTFRQWWHWKFLNCGRGSTAVLFGVPIYGNRFYDTLWFRGTVMPIFRLGRSLHDMRAWLRCRTFPKYRHHVVDTGLRPGWHDCDELMLHACMALLCRYVEWECGGEDKLAGFSDELLVPGSEGHGPRNVVEAQANTQNEALTIYRWWKYERPVDRARNEELLLRLYDQRRMKTEPTEDGVLHEIKFEPLVGEDIDHHKEFKKLEQKIDQDERMMLRRLIDIRQSLWT
jgi:hypothetical protein